MRILVLSFYYSPDIGPGALRIEALIEQLIQIGGKDIEIDLITTMPNRYGSLSLEAELSEVIGPLKINRVILPKHKNGILDQSFSFLSFAKEVLKISRKKNWDIIFATSSRLMTAALAAWIANKKNTKLYLDIRDLFTDTMEDILKEKPLRFVLPIFKLIEKKTFRSAHKINIVSEGFKEYINLIVPNLKPRVLTNGIDHDFLDFDFSLKNEKKFFTLTYAGNIGDGQGLHNILVSVAEKFKGVVVFQIIGDGGRKKDLELLIKNHNLINVVLIKPMKRRDLFMKYAESDALFLHLNNHKAFRRVLPSKLFEYAATGKPIIAGVSGYASKFIKKNIPGVEVFDPCNHSQMFRAIEKTILNPSIVDRSQFCENYLRSNILKELAKDILSL